ncbi:MAG: hypothetical protein M3Y58_01355 [Chloroflexota bacterium]|nr:hypothetical protein [Chloroflexota bacterium]
MVGSFFVGTADIVTIIISLLSMMAVIFVLIPTVMFFLARAAYRRIRRDPRVSRTALLWQEKTSPPGPRRSLMQLRVRLADAVTSARAAVSIIQAHGSVQGELASLVRRIDRVAAPLDAQLRLLQTEPDLRLLYELLQPARARVEEIEAIVHHIRAAAYATLGGDMAGTVAQITADVEREVAALQAGMSTLHALAMDTPAPVGVPLRKGAYR